jgi:hypothetical protein
MASANAWERLFLLASRYWFDSAPPASKNYLNRDSGAPWRIVPSVELVKASRSPNEVGATMHDQTRSFEHSISNVQPLLR